MSVLAHGVIDIVDGGKSNLIIIYVLVELLRVCLCVLVNLVGLRKLGVTVIA